MNLANIFVSLCLERIWFWNIKVVPPLAFVTENFLIKECSYIYFKGGGVGVAFQIQDQRLEKQADGPCR